MLSAPLRRRDFRLLWSGMSVSLLGDGVFLVAVAWQAYQVADRPSSLAYVGVSTSLPQVVLLLLGGAVSDRVPRRALLISADLIRAVAVAALAFLVAGGEARLPELCGVCALIGAATAFSAPAFDAFVPQLVPDRHLQQANGIDQFVRPAAIQLAGPGLGGVLVALFHPTGAFAFDAFSFVFSAGCIARISQRGSTTESCAERANYRREIADGFRYVRERTWLWGTFVSATFAYLLFLGPTQVLLPYLVKNSLHDGASTYGAVLAVGGVGALIGASLVGRRRDPASPMTFIYCCWTVATLAVAGYGIARDAWGLAAAALVVNGAEAAGEVIWATLKQRRVENAMLGRVSSIDWCVSIALLPMSYALTPWISRLLGVRGTLVMAGVVGAVVTFGFLFIPGMREGEGRMRRAEMELGAEPVTETA